MPLSALSILPPALLDLTLAVFARSNFFASGSTARRICVLPTVTMARSMHQAALATSPPPAPYEYPDGDNSPQPQIFGRGRRKSRNSLTVRSGGNFVTPASELERRVQALKETVVAEESVLSPSSYSEEELLSIYEDLLALPPTTSSTSTDPTTTRLARAQEDLSIINAVDQRFFGSQSESLTENKISPLLNTLRQRRGQTSSMAIAGETNESPHSGTLSAQPYVRVLRYFQDIVSRMEAVRASLSSSTNSAAPDGTAAQQEYLPISILSRTECECLTRVCIQARDGEAAELALDLLRRSGVSLPENSITEVLELYADNGEVTKAERFLSRFLTGPPTERQRHLHVKSHLKATPPHYIPTSSLAVLHSYEAQSHPAPMTTYTLLITALFSLPSSVARAQAWDLFTHMRYVAHPNPDALLYTLMIRACASPISSRASDPERALDLWTEMTIDHKIMPTVGSYSAIILACARSGSKMYVNEAFRLAKEMLDSHRDAKGRSAFSPDGRTFCALLEGAKRVGDLARARWILAEMVRGSRGDQNDNGVTDAEVTEEVMMHVFHAYAAYQPPFKRTDALLRNENPDAARLSQLLQLALPSDPESTEPVGGLPVEETQPTFTHIPPQSRSEVIAETKALFNRILDDTGAKVQDPSEDTIAYGDKKFKNVRLSPRLLNSYLSVYYKHSSLEVSQDLFGRIFEDLGVRRNARSYVEVLERCGTSRRGHERVLALNFAEEVWTKWQALEDAAQDGEDDGCHVSARMMERAHVAIIRVWTLTDNIDRAINHIKAFVERYPAADIRVPTPKPALRATRTVLVGARPLVRMTSTVEVPDDDVPPLLTFGDLDVLHHRLVAAGRRDEIGFLKYVCKTYEGALRARRDGTMKAEPAKTDAAAIVV